MDDEPAPKGSDMDLYLFLKRELEVSSCFRNFPKLKQYLGIAENVLDRMDDPLARELLRQEISKYKE